VVIKTLSIDWEGHQADVQYEDDIAWGDMDEILRRSVNLDKVATDGPQVNMAEYRFRLIMGVLRKAPFKWGDSAQVKKVPRKTMQKIMLRVMEDYPLLEPLADWMMSLMGSAMPTDLESDSTHTVQSSSDGPKEKPTNTDSNSLNKSSQPAKNTSKTQSASSDRVQQPTSGKIPDRKP